MVKQRFIFLTFSLLSLCGEQDLDLSLGFSGASLPEPPDSFSDVLLVCLRFAVKLARRTCTLTYMYVGDLPYKFRKEYLNIHVSLCTCIYTCIFTHTNLHYTCIMTQIIQLVKLCKYNTVSYDVHIIHRHTFSCKIFRFTHVLTACRCRGTLLSARAIC